MGGVTFSTRLAVKQAACRERQARKKAREKVIDVVLRKRERDRQWRKAHPNYHREWFTRKYGRVQAKLRKKSKSEREVALLLKIVRESQKHW